MKKTAVVTNRSLLRLIREEALRVVEGRGNVQSEPEFGDLLDAFYALEEKGFGAREISSAMSEYARRDQ